MERGWNSELLLAEMDWVRKLARALVRDRALADDVAQETWLVATEHQPDDARPLRPWLARVVMNLVRTRRRGEHRRGLREAANDLDRQVPKPDELVERVELQRMVAGEVLGLSEPHRSTVLLHFFEGMSSADIARQLGVPDATVRRRLKTALDQLRESLRRRENPPKQGWLAALIPLAELPEPQVAPAALGVLTMKKLIAVAILLALLVAIGVTLVRGRDHGAIARGPSSGGASTRGTRQLAPVPAWLAQPDVEARKIAGHVRAGGVPVAGATVRLDLQIDPQNDPVLAQPVAEVTTGTDGAFDFGAQPAAPFLVSASAPAHSPAAIVVANANPSTRSDQLVIELGDCSAKLVGTVSDASGGVIAKARLTTSGLGGTETDAAGRYMLCLPPNDEVKTAASVVGVEADGYGTITQRVIATGTLHHDFVLVPEAVLIGRVLDTSDHPIAGARVIAWPDDSEGPHFVTPNWAESDRDGQFRIPGLQPGKFQLIATAPRSGMATPVLAIARAAKVSREIRLVLSATARVRGRVVQSGRPVAGAEVAAVRAGLTPGTSSVSQADGSFVLDGVPFGPTSFVAAPYGVRTPTTLDVSRPTIDGVTLEVENLATLRGRVTRKGRPVLGAIVVVSVPRYPDHFEKTDVNGAFVIEGLAAGDASYSAWDRPSKAWAAPRQIRFAAGETRSVDIDLDAAGEAKGVVVDADGKPVSDVYVRMDLAGDNHDGCETLTDARGEFDCTALMGGEYVPMVTPGPGTYLGFAPAASAARFEAIAVPHDGAVTGIRLAIKHERLAIRGLVIDDTGATVPDVHVVAIAQSTASDGFGARYTMEFASGYSDSSGRFEIGNLVRGTYTLIAHAADGSETELPGNDAGGGMVTIKLARPGAIEGTLAGFSAPPSIHALMFVADVHVSAPAIVDGSTFSAVGLPPGRYLVQAIAGADTDGTSVDVHSGETVHVALRARGTGRVEGRVLELGTNKPFVGWHCEALLSLGGMMDPEQPPDESRKTTSDASGRYVLPAPLGRVRTGCIPQDGTEAGTWAGTDVDVTAGAVASVVVFAVRPTFGTTPGDPGLSIEPMLLPLTVGLVAPGGPAASAGLLAGDHIVSIDGAPLNGVLAQGATVLLMNHHPGSTAMVGIERGGSVRIVKITLAAGHS